MRIGLVLHGWPPREMGGTGLYVEALARALRAGGHEVAVIAPGRRPGIERVEQAGISGLRIGTWPALRFAGTWRRPGIDRRFARWIERFQPEVVHIHHLSGLGFGLPGVARRAGVRVVITLHDFFFACARGQLVDRGHRLCPGPGPDRCPPCVGGGKDISGRLRRTLLPEPPGGARLADARQALEQAQVLLAPSQDLARRMERLGLPPARVSPLPLLRPIPPASTPPPGPLRFLFAGAVIPTKGPHRLLDAFQQLPPGEAELSIAGPAPAFPGWPDFGPHLRSRVQRTPGARWLGPIAPEAIAETLAAHDVLVLPSTWPENSPLIVREATAAGLRVIVGSLGGAPELVPGAPTLGPEDPPDRLAGLLRQEILRGRGRNPPRSWPDPAEHARDLLESAYRR